MCQTSSSCFTKQTNPPPQFLCSRVVLMKNTQVFIISSIRRTVRMLDLNTCRNRCPNLHSLNVERLLKAVAVHAFPSMCDVRCVRPHFLVEHFTLQLHSPPHHCIVGVVGCNGEHNFQHGIRAAGREGIIESGTCIVARTGAGCWRSPDWQESIK